MKVGIVNNQFRCDIFMKYFLIETKPKIIIWHKEPTFLTKIVLLKNLKLNLHTGTVSVITDNNNLLEYKYIKF